MPVTTRPRPWPNWRPRELTRSSHRRGPATARGLSPRPGDGYPEGGLSARDRMRRKLRTKRGRARYALRMETAEPVFRQIKQGRGFRQLLLRGLEKVNREWLLICAGHNLLKLFRFGANPPSKNRGNGPPGAAGEQRRAVIIPTSGTLAQCRHSASSGTVAVS